MTQRIQVLKKEMQQAGYSILCASLSLIGKLEGVQLWVDNWQDGVQQQFLQAFHNFEYEGNRSIVVEFSELWLLGDRDYGSHFPDGGCGGSRISFTKKWIENE